MAHFSRTSAAEELSHHHQQQRSPPRNLQTNNSKKKSQKSLPGNRELAAIASDLRAFPLPDVKDDQMIAGELSAAQNVNFLLWSQMSVRRLLRSEMKAASTPAEPKSKSARGKQKVKKEVKGNEEGPDSDAGGSWNSGLMDIENPFIQSQNQWWPSLPGEVRKVRIFILLVCLRSMEM